MKVNPKEQKAALEKLLRQLFGDNIEREKQYEWMRTDFELIPLLNEVHNKLLVYCQENKNYYKPDYYKPNVTPKCDYVFEPGRLIIEYDERQHFSRERKVALDSYKNKVPLSFNADKWVDACEEIHATDNNPPWRDEQRALYDSVRDLAAYQNGYTLRRIKYDDFDWTSDGALEHLKKILL